MTRATTDLEANAALFWPAQLAEREQRASIIPRLIETQEKFIGVLYVADASPGAWKTVLAATEDLPANLFLKHLAVLADVGGEKLQRFRTNLKSFFRGGIMSYAWRGERYSYVFRSLRESKVWTNAQLGIDGAGLATAADLRPEHEDVAMLLLHGASSTDPRITADLTDRCNIGTLMGRKKELDSFVRQRYIHVSRITGGATANKMGQLCQSYVRERLTVALPAWKFSKKTIPGISQNAGRTDISFDLIAQSPTGKYCAIEVSFQVTTNSTIERKAGQAEARRLLLHRNGHHIAYVIDGAGNFERKSAIATICENSDCTVTLKDSEIDRLAVYLRSLGTPKKG